MTAVLDLPSTREEAWRWADLGALSAAAALAPVAAPAHEFLDLPGARLLFVDGVLDEARSQLHRVELTDLPTSDHALGRRAAGKGWRLSLDARAAADPVQVVHVATGRENHLPAHIHLGDDAVAQVVETFVGAGWQNRHLSVTLGKGARLMRSVRLLQPAGFVSLREEADVGAAASLVAVFLGAGGQGSRIDARLTLGDGAFGDYGGALLTAGEQRQECAVRVNHAQPDGSSRQLWRAVAADRSQASLAAAVEVARHAQKTDGEQSLRGLLLHRTATVNLKPELEIFADDVKCAHGATVGELDARALFYMESRGIPRARAQALLTRAFVNDALERIGDETTRAAFEADADAWLEASLSRRERSVGSTAPRAVEILPGAEPTQLGPLGAAEGEG
ncbi:SufD family Fe-S cluster assembly protein [Sphingomonas corticis]|jgi:Fe-S cluster assembly protein SufD|uniref:SufD family Fe-S cluster assembly protein n=1 Tax=Sphingomonas corticis TaxID=2722791 RepID=A0ABX1CLU5_9SPHN|nr:SufD family Fe-S cluster assembly protein [Sphingomonas corticis]NJR78951.1 SufD family Fe-S cluster assembly protein [Sphingomonas corticis]